MRLVVLAVTLPLALACSSKREVSETDNPTPGAATTLASWPADGVCPLGGGVADSACQRLSQSDGEAMATAARAYLAEPATRAEHRPEDLVGALRSVGELHMQTSADGGADPKIGLYFVYADRASGGVYLQSTEAINEGRRWGYRIDFVRRGTAWVATAFNRWRAWGRRSETFWPNGALSSQRLYDERGRLDGKPCDWVNGQVVESWDSATERREERAKCLAELKRSGSCAPKQPPPRGAKLCIDGSPGR